VVKEGGRLPLRRGPKALQLEGVPFYELTDTGLLVASSIEELGDRRMGLLKSYVASLPSQDASCRAMKDGLLLLIDGAPLFVSKVINEYIYAYSTGQINSITPLEAKKLRSVIAKQIAVERELVDAFVAFQPDQKDAVRNFFKVLS
jgi:hypothetical protein